MSDAQPERAWFDKADQDLEMARRALGPENALPVMACYHAQQCAEKDLKGYLVSRAIRFRFVHDLIYLIQLCGEREPAFEELMSAAEVLGEYGTAVRYPMEGEEEPDEETAREAIGLAEQIATFVVRRSHGDTDDFEEEK